VKYLGGIIDEKLNWSSHLKHIETKLGLLSFCFKCDLQNEKHITDIHTQITIFWLAHI